MGTDATAFLEFWEGAPDLPVWGRAIDPGTIAWDVNGIESVVDGPVQIGRNYLLYGALAGVRAKSAPLVAPRGLPPTISWHTARRAFRRIHADDVPPEHLVGRNSVSHSEAERRVTRGTGRYGGPSRHGQFDCVTEEVYSASWLYLREVEASLAHHGMTVNEQNIFFASVIASMRLIESRLGPDRARLVFWFDTLEPTFAPADRG